MCPEGLATVAQGGGVTTMVQGVWLQWSRRCGFSGPRGMATVVHEPLTAFFLNSVSMESVGEIW